MSRALYYSHVFTFKFMATCPGGSMVGWSLALWPIKHIVEKDSSPDPKTRRGRDNSSRIYFKDKMT